MSDSTPHGRRRGPVTGRGVGRRRTGRSLGAPAAPPASSALSAGQNTGGGRGDAGRQAAEGSAPRTPEEAEYARAKEILLRQLTAAARSRAQLAQKLAEKEISEETATRILDRYEDLGLIDDAEYAAMYVRSRSASRKLARPALRRELAQKGIDPETAQRALSQRTEEDEREDARALVRRRLRPERDLADPAQREKALRRLVAMLARRGYAPGVAFEIVRTVMAEHGETGLEEPPGLV